MSRNILLPPVSENRLSDGARLGGWWHEDEDEGRMVCDLCPRACHLKPGDRGFCFVRENRDGQMVLATYGRSTGFCIDPIEKKPLNHFYPGTSVLSFGTAGCNLGCKFCQNHDISKSREVERLSESASPAAIARAAREFGCRSVAFTYNDPVIWAEYAIDTAKACHKLGIKTVAVTAGYITEAARGSFFEHFDAANVDLKGFTEEFYQQLTLSHLQPVLDTLKWLCDETDVWFEITNLVIPRANDSDDEFKQMCGWILDALGDQTPVHFTAFHPDFRLLDRPRTPAETLLRARAIAVAAGLKYVYVGNVDDERHQSTYCGSCGQLLIQRNWYQLGAYHLRDNRCGHCQAIVPGHFDSQPGNWGRKRQPVRISEFADPPLALHSIREPKIREPAGQPTHLSTGSTNIVSTTANAGAQDSSPAVRSIALSNDQRRAVHTAASELLAAAVLGRPARLADPALAGSAELPVLGAYVSVKRQGKLRACCGFLGATVGLGEAIATAAARSATDDPRLPRISTSELPWLDLETWLLFDMLPMAARGMDRVEAVVVGRHGLRISRAGAAGLLLPGVAIEAGLDSEGFLQHVCLKAGLPPTAWKEDDVELHTFEGIAVDGRLDPSVAASIGQPDREWLTAAEMSQLTRTCRENARAVLIGAMPSYYIPECSDGMIAGAAISLQLPQAPGQPGNASGRTSVSKLSFRPGLPMQATLYSLAEAAAQMLARSGVGPASLAEVFPEVTILYDTAMHGTVGEPDLAGFDPEQRALLVAQGNRSAWLFDPSLSTEALLQKVVEMSGIRRPAEAALYSLRAQASRTPASVVHRPLPQAGADIRPAAVAGSFYPADPQQLAAQVEALIASNAEPVEKRPYRAALVPHAGLIYSGRVAADVLRRIEIPSTVIVLGPKHTPLGVDWAVAPHRSWSLPGTEIESDRQLAAELAAEIDGLELDAAAHEREHAIEVELPLLARLAPAAKVVGIAIGPGNFEDCRALAAGLAAVLKRHSEPALLLVSTDMNHFASDEENRRLDELAMRAIEQRDPRQLYDTVRENHISMCGLLPCVVVMLALEELGGFEACQRVAYATSADTTGDRTRVVGYAGMLFE